MSAEWLDPLVQRLGWTLLHFIWQGALVGVLFGLGLLALRDAGDGSRYALAVATLAILALLPTATFIYLGASAGVIGPNVITVPVERLVIAVGPELGAAPGPDLLLWIVAAWLAGVLVMTSRLWLGWRYLVRLRHRADPGAADSLKPLLEQLCRGIGIARQVQIAVSRQVRSPVVIGWLKPLILLPPAVINHLPRDHLAMVLAHELAHIRRHDHLVNLFQTAVETLLFYHPMVAWVSRQIRIERENACDDLVVSSTGNRLAYVEMLAALERMRFRGPQLVLAMNDGQILGRIRRLVEQARPRRQHGLVLPAMLLAATLVAGIGFRLLPEDPGAEPDRTGAIASAELNRAAANETAAAENVERPTPPSVGRPRALDAPAETPAGVEAAVAVADQPRPSPVARLAAGATSPSEAMGAAASESARPDVATPAPETTRQAEDEDRPARSVASRPDRSAAPSIRDRAGDTPPTETGAAEPLQMAALPRESLPGARAVEPETVALKPAPITGGDLIRRIEPDYPGRAHRRLTDGKVELEFVVDEEGRVDDIEIVQEIPERWRFGEAAAEAVAQWRFEPFQRAGQPMARTVRVEVVFEPDRSTCPSRTGTRIPNC